MEFKSLFLGILFSVGVFSIKAGVGLHYRLGRDLSMTREKRPRVLLGLGFAVLYALLFAAVGAGVAHMEIKADLAKIRLFLESGMVIHFTLAALMLIWGFVLLKSKDKARPMSSGWIALVFPCPLCMTVIGISIAFILAIFPDSAAWAIVLFYLAFMALSFLTAALMERFRKSFKKSPEYMLGYAMATIAAYFLLSILIMPQFSGIDEVYRLAANSKNDNETAKNFAMLPIAAGIIASFFAAGYFYMERRIVRSMSQK